MKKASQDLVIEHEAIVLTLNVLERITSLLEAGISVEISDIARIIYFITSFADKCHNGKEEMFLYPAFEEAGIRNENGPIGVMLAEHERGRDFVRIMKESVFNGSFHTERFIQAASGYINLLTNHIRKENFGLFPTGDVKLQPEKQAELARKFQTFEKVVIGRELYCELRAIPVGFAKKYLI